MLPSSESPRTSGSESGAGEEIDRHQVTESVHVWLFSMHPLLAGKTSGVAPRALVMAELS
jgi:hypothetical protein